MKQMSFVLYRNLAIFSFVIIFSQCATGQKGSGNVIKESRSVESFNEIEVGGAFEVFIRQDVGNEEVSIVADDNLIDNIEIEVNNGVLEISYAEYLKNYTELKVYVTVKNLNRVEASGACNIYMKNTLMSDEFNLELSGASDADLNLESNNIYLEVTGASDVTAVGKARTLELEASGASTIKCYDLEVESANVEAAGASTVMLTVRKELSAEASGASTIKYKGDPEIEAEESGAAEIIHIDKN